MQNASVGSGSFRGQGGLADREGEDGKEARDEVDLCAANVWWSHSNCSEAARPGEDRAQRHQVKCPQIMIQSL